MKKVIDLKVALVALAAAGMFASCSDDGPDGPDGYYRVIGFENSGLTLAGPTSKGDNLYESYDGTKFLEGRVEVESGVDMVFGINESLWDDEYNFWNGGMALSQWNIRSNTGTNTGDWWYSWNNQCSVYNTASTDGANTGAGAGGSNTFAVINGYSDNNSMSSMAQFSFTANAEYTVESIEICPPSYLYGVITAGNQVESLDANSLINAKGWFKIMAYGYDANGDPTNGGLPVEKYICDYRADANPKVPIATTWQTWDLSALGKVNTVKFNFDGSDKGSFGLNTPAYMCIDDIRLRLN